MSQFQCPKCNFVQGYLTLHARTGNISDNPGPTVPPKCPNDGAELRPVTCPSPDCGCESCQQREVDEAAGINYKAGEY